MELSPPDFSTLRSAYDWGIVYELEGFMLTLSAPNEPPDDLVDELMAHGDYITYLLALLGPSEAVH